MYKSKLQELCQRHSWELPVYETKREGPDHNPRFQATICVNGVSLQSRECRTMKMAQNDVARAALRHFTSGGPDGSPPANNASAINISYQQRLLQERAERAQDPQFSAPVPVVEVDNRTNVNISNPQRLLQERAERAQDPQFSAPVPVVEVDNRTNVNISNPQRLLQERAEIGGDPQFSEPVSVLEVDNRAKGSSPENSVTAINISDQQRLLQERAEGTSQEMDGSTSNVANQQSCQKERQEVGRIPDVSVSTPIVKDDTRTEGMHYLYKNQLQTYTQKRNLPLPVYVSEREGPPHASRFRSKVTVGEQTFESQEFFPTLKEAEHAAAKIALALLVPNSGQEDDSVVYKNLLQEMAQREGYQLPVYSTNRSGAVHFPTFLATVDVAGKVFEGNEAKTKKLAEMSAAKVAYLSLKEGIRSQAPPLPLSSQRQDVPQRASPTKSMLTGDLREEHPVRRPKMAVPDVPSKWVEVPEEELLFPPYRLLQSGNGSGSSVMNPSAESAEGTTVGALSVDQIASPSPAVGDNNTESPAEKTGNELIRGSIGGGRFMSGEHVVVRPWRSGMTLPPGSKMVFRDDKWIAYRLASQANEAHDNEKGKTTNTIV